MRMNRPSKLLLTAVLSGVSCIAFAAEWRVSGTVVDESGDPIAGAYVEAGGRRYDVDTEGGFVVAVDSSELLTLTIGADGYYGSIHTLHVSDATSGTIEDFVVELVARAPSRRLLLFAGDAMRNNFV